MPETMNARLAVWQGLVRMQKGAYSNLLLDSIHSSLSGRERQFASQLFYGVLEREITLRYNIQMMTGRSPDRLDAEVVAALELALYQILFMDSVPDSAAVNESVNLIRHSRKKSASGFVNGVLRSFLRKDKTVPLPKGRLARASIETAMPEWILSRWEQDYGWDTALSLAQACLGRPPIQLRVNTLRTDRSALAEELTRAGVTVALHPLLPDALSVSDTGALGDWPAIREGRCYVQDAASQLCAAAVDPRPGERVFDLCAAPGGKSFTLAQRMEDKGELFSFDLHQNRVHLIEEGARRLGIHSIRASSGDSGKYDPSLGTADRVLCDVSCAGLGVIRRKPEIRRKTPEEVAGLPTVQARILDNASHYLRPGGVLVYSTCSLNKEENERQAERFLAEHPDFEPLPLPEIFSELVPPDGDDVTLMPQKGGYDGFYVARFRKRA